ncbi:MAG: SIMPL domain-containing protein [Pseudomonadota bacterium]
MSLYKLLVAATFACSVAHADTLVVVPAFGEVVHANDQATITFSVEEQDKDKAAAASRVNQKMKQGAEIVRKEDPHAQLKTQGYYTYAVYDNTPSTKPRVPTGWRVGQSLEVKTTSLDGLPKMAAAAQKILGLNNLRFELSPALTKTLDEQRIAATYKNLNERVASIARAMGRPLSDATIETIDFEGSGNYVEPQNASFMRAAPMAMKAQQDVAEPSFEPGETTLQMHLVGKVRFK